MKHQKSQAPGVVGGGKVEIMNLIQVNMESGGFCCQCKNCGEYIGRAGNEKEPRFADIEGETGSYYCQKCTEFFTWRAAQTNKDGNIPPDTWSNVFAHDRQAAAVEFLKKIKPAERDFPVSVFIARKCKGATHKNGAPMITHQFIFDLA